VIYLFFWTSSSLLFWIPGTKLTLPTTTPPHFIESVEAVYKLFDQIGSLCLDIATSAFDVPLAQVLAAYGDPCPLPASAWATSVFNVFHYFNTPESLKAQNCVEHIDPGFITGTKPTNPPKLPSVSDLNFRP
jgi:hypothetical protein